MTITVGDKRIDAIDVAHYQLIIDWHAVVATGVFLGACKATQSISYVDPTFLTNRLEMKAAGLKYRLFYHWLQPGRSGREQADFIIKVVGPLEVGEGIMLDVEDSSNGGVTELQTLACAETLEAHYGRPVAVYTGAFVSGGSIWRSEKIFNGKRPRILAAYTSRAKAVAYASPYGWDMWQWSSTQMVPGVPVRVDCNEVASTKRFDPVCGITETSDHPPVVESSPPVVVSTVPPLDPNPPTPDATLDDVAISILHSESGEFNAAFFAVTTADGRSIQCEWTGDGRDPRVQERINAHLNAGAKWVNITLGGLRQNRLIGGKNAADIVDSKRTWTDEDFAH